MRGEGNILLGFNEPDMASQANMTRGAGARPVAQADGDGHDARQPRGGVRRRHAWRLARPVHGRREGSAATGSTSSPCTGTAATSAPARRSRSSQCYLQAIYDRYHLPIWLTEFALTSYSGGTATFPAEAQQAAFLTAATTMLDGLSYLQRYAWFALPTSSGSGTTGLFDPGPSATQVGRAFESAR